MTTYHTGNPLGSQDPRDLFDNAQNMDHAANSQTADTWIDRLGRVRKTWHGIEKKSELDIEQAVSVATAEAESYRDEARDARDDAKAAAGAIGPIRFYDTLPQAISDIENLMEGDLVEIARDSEHDFSRTRRELIAGAFVFVINLDQVRADILSPSGTDALGGFTSYAELRAYLGTAKRTNVIGVLGSKNPGVYGLFERDDGDAASADDGGFIIVDGLGRRWKRKGATYLTPEMFGAKGDDSSYDDGEAINRLIVAAIREQIPARMAAKSYYMLTKVAHTTESPGFEWIGAGFLRTILVRGNYASSGVSIYRKSGLKVSGMTVDNRWKSGNDAAGVAWDFAHIQDADLGYLRGMNCATYAGWVISGTDQITNNNVNLHDCVGFNTGGSGWQIQGARKSGHLRNKAINCGGDSSETGTGTNFKVPFEDVWHIDCYSENVDGMGWSVGSSFPGVYGRRLSSRGFRSKNIGIGMRFGETEDSTVDDAVFDLKGIGTDPNLGSVGHGVWLVNGARRNKISARVNNVAASRGVVTMADNTTTGNTVIVDGVNTPVAGATLASFGTSVNNEVFVRKGYTEPSVLRSDSGTGNVLEFEGIPYAQPQTAIAAGNLKLHHTKVASVLIDTENNDPTDDLVTISPGVPGQTITLMLNANTRVVTVKHGNVMMNGIRLTSGADFVFNNTRDMLRLSWNSRSSQWIQG